MDYESFTAHVLRCRQIWQDFQQSFDDPDLKTFLKHSYPVLCCLSGQCTLEAADYYSLALWSPRSLIPNKASGSLIEHIRALESLKKDGESRRNKDEKFKKEQDKVKKRLEEFNFGRLELEDHRLEVRFPSLKMDLIQKIKMSSFVDQEHTGKDRASIRVVLWTP
jgi:hypothetical protein